MEKVLVIVGPTAVGKTALSVELAQLFGERSSAVIHCKSIKIWISVQQKSKKKR